MNFKKNLFFVILTTAIIGSSFSFLYAELPEGESVIEGQIALERSEDSLKINVLTDKAIIEWQKFNIGGSQTVYFYQPSINSQVLNRVVGNEISNILGNLFAQGNIILINPNGINIGPSANINVASLIASTLDISNQDFLSGNYKFFKTKENAFLFNQGNIIVRNGGYVALLSQAVDNSGMITAQLGTVVLASGEEITLALDDLGEISVVVDKAVQSEVFGPNGEKINSAIKNSGTISADGGKIILTAKVLNKVFDYAINNEGIIEAKDLVEHNGVVELVASGAPVINIGKIEAGKVNVNTDSDFINKGKIISDGNQDLPSGGKVFIEAETILQQGLISANAAETGTAGEIIIISQTSTTLDTHSTTEAKALGIVGNGGRILIDSKVGNTLVNNLAVIDVSAGSISGNAGFIEISAYKQLGFYGILNGRAPPGYRGGVIFIDPHSSTIGPASFGNNTTTYYWTEEDLTITGDISLGKDAALYLLADHKSETPGDWDTANPGSGAILNPSGYKISGGSQGDRKLYLYAGSGIGTVDFPILTENITDLTAILNPNAGSGGIYINQSGSRVLHINSASTRDGNIEITSAGSIEVNGKINAGNRIVTLTATEIDIKLNQEDAISAENINLRPANIGRNILIGGNDRPANTFTLTDNDLDRLACAGTVTIGRADGTGAVEIEDINLSDSGGGKKNEDYNLVILGGKVTVSGSIIMNTDKSITITSKGDLTVKENITTTGAGTIALIADADEVGLGVLIFNTGITLTSSSAHYLQGNNNFDINAAFLNRLIGGANTLTIKSTANDIKISTSINKNNITLISKTGAIIDNNTIGNDLIAINLILSAATGIGSDDALETEVSNLSARVTSTTATGNIKIVNTRDLTLDNLAGWEYAVRNFGSGQINIKVNSNLTIDDPVMTNGGNITLTANSGAIIQNAAGDITTLGGKYQATAAGPYTMANGAVVNSGSGLIDIDAGGDITISQLISSSTVFLNSGGAILDITDDTLDPDVVAGSVEFRAVNGIGILVNPIDTSVGWYMAGLTTDGQICINEIDYLVIARVGFTDGVSVTNGGPIWLNTNGGSLTFDDANQDITSNGGPITILAGAVTQNNGADILSSGGNINMTITSLTQSENSKIDAGAGSVEIDATGNIALDEINGNTVDISTTGGSIEETAETPDIIDITATNLILSAKNGIGSITDALETSVNTLSATASNGSIYLSNNKDLVVTSATALGVGNDIEITVNSNLTVGSISAPDTVTLTASGSIIDDNGDANNVTANNLILSAATGIGWDSVNGSNALETRIANLSAYNSNSGNIEIANEGPLNLIAPNSWGYAVKNDASDGKIIITAYPDCPLTIYSAVIAKGDVTLTAGEEKNKDDDDITINADIISTAGDILLQAGDDIIQNSGTIQTQTSGKTISLIAAYKDSDGIGAIIQNSSGKIGIDSTSSSLWTNLVLSAIEGITLPNTDITNLQATNTSTGDIEITNTGNNAGIYTFGSGVVNKGTGNIRIISKNPVTIDSPVKAEQAGDIYIKSVNDFQINNLISTSDEGKVTLIATGTNGYIKLQDGKVIGGSEVVLQADTEITMDSDTSIENDGDISLTAGKDIKISKVFSSSSVGKITITTSTGAIIDNNGNATNIIANKLILSAAEGIGSGDALETDVNTLNATNTTSGNIEIDNDGDLIIGSVTAPDDVIITVSGSILDDTDETNYISGDTINLSADDNIGSSSVDGDIDTKANTIIADAGGDIYLEEFDGAGFSPINAGGTANIFAHGSSTLGSITTGGNFNFSTTTGAITISGSVTSIGGITLIALGGSIIPLGAGPHLSAGGSCLLQATGVIGSLPVPFNINLTAGDLTANIGSSIGGISGVFSGSTPSGTILHNSPPGIIYFNGLQIWPPLLPIGPSGPSGYLLSQYAHSLIFRFLLPYLEQLAQLQINTFNPVGPVYFYHPLTPLDMSAFDEFILEEGAYEFIEGAINILGHEGLLPILEDIKKKTKP